MKIVGLQKLSLIDYPGKPSCVVFLGGCNLRCPWCHSPDLVDPDLIKKAPEIEKEEFFSFLKKRKKVLEGVVVCGGEPTVNEKLPDFIEEISSLGYSVKLDTNGTNPDMLESLLKKNLLDYVAMDLKAPPERYKEAIGTHVSSSTLRKSIELIKKMEDYEFRTTVVPGIHEKKDLIDIAKSIKGAKRYYLQNFRGKRTLSKKFQGKDSFDKEFLEEVKEEISDFFEICKIR